MRKQTKGKDVHHPMETYAQQIEKQGVMVFDDVTSMPAYGEPYASSHFVIALNHQGNVKGQYDMKPIEFHTHDFAVVYPDHLLMMAESSPDYQATLVVLSQSILQEIRHRSPHRFQLEYINQPHFHLEDEQYETAVMSINLLRAACRLTVSNRESILVSLLDTLSLLIDAYRFPNNELSPDMPAGKQLFARFYDDIVKYHRESHEVKFYAKRLCFSPKYFSFLIRQETGVAAPDWIARYVIVQAKSLLRSNLYTMQEVSDRLGFSEQSAFSRYFRHHTGITPTQFRREQLAQR